MKCPKELKIKWDDFHFILGDATQQSCVHVANDHLDKIFDGAEVVYGACKDPKIGWTSSKYDVDTYTAILLKPQAIETEPCKEHRVTFASSPNCCKCGIECKAITVFVPVDESKK